MKPISTLFLALTMFAAAAPAIAADDANSLFQEALVKERTAGNLTEAIKLYQRIVDKYAGNHKVAAEVLVRLGECYEKQGNADARKTYEQVLSKFGDQKDAVAEARARLAALAGASGDSQPATRLAWAGSKVTEGSLSPDGRFISFPDWDTGNLGIHDLAAGTDRLLTTTGTYKRGESAYIEGSVFSGDGKQIAYAWYEEKLDRTELRVIGVNGDPAPRRIFGSENVGYLEPAGWSSDGKWISAYLWSNHDQTRQVGLIGVADGSLRVLKSQPQKDNLMIGSFSPDGRYVVYTLGIPATPRSYIVSVDGQPEVPLLTDGASSRSPVWTPDGSRIVFVSNRSGSQGVWWSVRVVDGKPVGEPERVKVDISNGTPMAFARDGSLYYSVDSKVTDIYVAGLDPATGKVTSEPRPVNDRAVGNSWGRIAWLPDGKSLSFWNKLPIPALVVHTLATDAEREILGGKSGRPGYGYNGWFQDGSLMARQGDNSVEKRWIFRRMDSGTGETRETWTVPVPDGNLNQGRAVNSPDMMTIFFSKQDQATLCAGGKCTWIMSARSVENGQDRELFRINASQPRNASLSQDGSKIAFVSADEIGSMVMVAPTAGGTPREIYRVAEDSGNVGGTAWTRDGGHVLLLHGMKSGAEILSLPVNGGSPERSGLRMQPSELPAVSPDGTQVAFVGGDYASEIWVMTGLFPAAKTTTASK